MISEYAHPEVLVETDWAAAHLEDPGVRVVEVDIDTTQYDKGHLPGAIGFDWQRQLNDQIRRDIIGRRDLEALLSAHGIENRHTLVLYGDNNNWFAAFAFWILKIYGHADVRLMNGGRKKWVFGEGRPLTTNKPAYPPGTYKAKPADQSLRAYREQVLEASADGKQTVIDVRTPEEFAGEVVAPPGLAETAQRGGHIPGARNVRWEEAVQEDGTFKPADDLRKVYGGRGITRGRKVITYCRIGERSAHTWFVLKYLVGVLNVRNYDGSWTEWGSVIGAPIEKGTDSQSQQRS
ncbi:MAG: thiosulfate sulfurtransferase [Acidobacteria bacterium RIFCSPLOWO2_02_FULL_68_18]|nr:MAG: thiosulfate sulfurtransferase [Acidobacteria bacterium RIFCSPLOWO2_02_FULL_68_18]OFW49831.1 MAG: thiosulfate sulfurtransferase [Acidobacteria bacterium RIFCSPLOWO2_12_FULL_68_19]